MGEVLISSEILTLVITLVGSLSVTMPFIAKFKIKLTQAKVLLNSIDLALEDDKISKPELQHIAKLARDLIGTKL